MISEISPNVQRYNAEKHAFVIELRFARHDARAALTSEHCKEYYNELSNRCLANAQAALVWMEESCMKKEIPSEYLRDIVKMRRMYDRSDEYIIKQQLGEVAA